MAFRRFLSIISSSTPARQESKSEEFKTFLAEQKEPLIPSDVPLLLTIENRKIQK